MPVFFKRVVFWKILHWRLAQHVPEHKLSWWWVERRYIKHTQLKGLLNWICRHRSMRRTRHPTLKKIITLHQSKRSSCGSNNGSCDKMNINTGSGSNNQKLCFKCVFMFESGCGTSMKCCCMSGFDCDETSQQDGRLQETSELNY